MYSMSIVVGNLGGDPEMKYLQEGTPVTNFSIAEDRSYSKDGEKVEKVQWWKVVAWRKLAEVANQYLVKGRQVLVEGTVTSEAWTSNGEAKSNLVITAKTIKFLGKRGDVVAEYNAPKEEELPF